MAEDFPFVDGGDEDDAEAFVAPTPKADQLFQRLCEGKPIGPSPAVTSVGEYGFPWPEGEEEADLSSILGRGPSDPTTPGGGGASLNADGSGNEGVAYLAPGDVTVTMGDGPGEVVLIVGTLARVVFSEDEARQLIASLEASLEASPGDESFPDNPETSEVEAVMVDPETRWVQEKALRVVAKIFDLNDPRNYREAKALYEKLVRDFAGWDGVVKKGTEERSSGKASFRSPKVSSPPTNAKRYKTARQRRTALSTAIAKRKTVK